MSAIISGIMGAVVATTIGLLAERNKKPGREDANGWKNIGPGWVIYATLIGCAFFVSPTSFILLTGGSTRPDADEQNFYIVLLLIGFGLGGLAMGWSTYGKTVMWKGDVICVQRRFGGRSAFAISDVLSVQKSEMRSEYRLTFRDGSKLSISTYMRGLHELISEIQRLDNKP